MGIADQARKQVVAGVWTTVVVTPTTEELATVAEIVAVARREGKPVPHSVAFESGAVVECAWSDDIVTAVEAAYEGRNK